VGFTHPTQGRPSVLAPHAGGGLLVGTEEGWLLTLDPDTGAMLPLAGPESGLTGELVGITTSPDGRRVRVASSAGAVFEVTAGRVRAVAAGPAGAEEVLAHLRTEPQRRARLVDPLSGVAADFALADWVVWRVTASD
jgi:hypothetical protein